MGNELFLLLILLATGTVSGFFSSTPLGPINLLIANSVVTRFDMDLRAFLSGVILADVVFAFLAFWGYYTFFSETTFGKVASIVGGGFIVVLGLMNLLKVLYKDDTERPVSDFREGKAFHSFKDFTKGLALCGSNPAFLLFWVYIATTLEKYRITDLNVWEIGLVLIGIVIGDFLWFGLFIRLLKMGAKRLKVKLIRNVRIGISVVLIVLGLSTVVATLLGIG